MRKFDTEATALSTQKGFNPSGFNDNSFNPSLGRNRTIFNQFRAIALLCPELKDIQLEGAKNVTPLKKGIVAAEWERVQICMRNGWNTEYSMKLSLSIQDESFHCGSLQWLFPQAYYSVYQNLRAYHIAKCCSPETHMGGIKLFSEDASIGLYPAPFNLWVGGGFKDLKLCPQGCNLTEISARTATKDVKTDREALIEICRLLMTTRINQAENFKKRNPKAVRKKSNGKKKGSPKKKWSESDWNRVFYAPSPYTSILTYLYRQRINSNYEDISALQDFDKSNLSGKEFHENVLKIVLSLNFVHEVFVARKVGYRQFRAFVNSCQGVSFERTIQERIHLIEKFK